MDLHVLAVDLERLAGQERAECRELLVEHGQDARRFVADLAHPVGHAVTDAHDETVGVDLGEGVGFERRECRVAHGRGQDADSHPDALGRRERDRGLGEPAAEEAVFDHPEFVEAEFFGLLHEGHDLVGREVAGQHDADGGSGHGHKPRGEMRRTGRPVRARPRRR